MNTTLGAAARALENTAASAFSLSPTDPCTCQRANENNMYISLDLRTAGGRSGYNFGC